MYYVIHVIPKCYSVGEREPAPEVPSVRVRDESDLRSGCR